MKRSASQPITQTTGFGELGREMKDPEEEDDEFLAVGSLKASVFALITATLGAGSLSLPYAFGSSGIAMGLLLLAVIGVASHYTIHFLVCSLSVRELSSYEELAVACGGRTLGIITECSIILFCFGTAVGYLITLSRILSTVVRSSFGFHGVSDVGELLVVSVFVLLPLCLTERVGELRWSCIVGVASVGLVTLIVVYHFFCRPRHPARGRPLQDAGVAVLGRCLVAGVYLWGCTRLLAHHLRVRMPAERAVDLLRVTAPVLQAHAACEHRRDLHLHAHLRR
jgi:hypothetical protein